MSGTELNRKARLYFRIQDQIDALQAEAEAIRDSMKAVMVERETEELDGEGWRATWHNARTSRFDSRAFKAAHADLYAAFTIKGVGTRFTLSQISG